MQKNFIFRQDQEILKKYVASKLLKQIDFFVFVILVILFFGFYNFFRGKVSFYFMTLGISLGLFFGFLAGRMFKICWCEKTEKVISKIDKIGLVVFVVYVFFDVIGELYFRRRIADKMEFLNFSLFLMAGLLTGRLLAIVRKIKKVLARERKV